jgi:phenylacetate-CoA ligase
MTPLLRALGANLSFPLAERYTRRNIWQKKTLLDAWQHESAVQKNHRINTALCDVIDYAATNVPYYRNLFKRIRFEPAKLRTDIRYFQDIPFLTKETILAQPDDFLSTEFRARELTDRKTSGSTGLTLSFYYSKSDLDWASAVIFHLNARFARSLSDREVQLSFVDPSAPPEGLMDEIRGGLRAITMNRATVYLRGLSALTARTHLRAIRAQKPYLIYGLQSTLKALIQFAETPAQYHQLCEYFVSSGETLDAHSARLITDAIGCKVINRYGNAEFGAIAQSIDDPSILKIIDGLVLPENFGTHGFSEIVLTTLVGRGMPLIRYRTGDLGNVDLDADGSYRLSAIQGRLHDLVVLGGKTFTTSFLSTGLHGKYSIHDFQIVQRGSAPPEFRVVTDQPEQLPLIQRELTAIAGVEVKVSRIRPTDLIRKGRQMKFSHYVREQAEV